MIRAEAIGVLRAIFAGFPSVRLTDDMVEMWFDIALRDSSHLDGMRIARALASTCDYAPVPKQFIEMKHAAKLREGNTLAPSPEWKATLNGRVWAHHCVALWSGIDVNGKRSNDGHMKIEGDAWTACPACRAYAREITAANASAS